WHEEELAGDVTDAALAAVAERRDVLVDERYDDSRDERPVARQRGRHDRLDVERRLVAVARIAERVVPVVLERHADHRCDGIAEIGGEVGIAALRVRGRGGERRQYDDGSNAVHAALLAARMVSIASSSARLGNGLRR